MEKADKEYTQTAIDLLRNDTLLQESSSYAEGDRQSNNLRSEIVGNDITEPNRQSEESLNSASHTPRRKSYSRTSASGNEGERRPSRALLWSSSSVLRSKWQTAISKLGKAV